MSGQIRIRRDYSFTCLPEHLTRCRMVSDRAVRLWALLDRYGAGDPSVALTREVLAADLRCSLDSVDRAITKLRAAGWMTDNGARGGRPREYVLHSVVRTHADNLPHPCGQPAAPMRTTDHEETITDLRKQPNRRPPREKREEKNPPNPPAAAGGNRAPCAKHMATLGRPHLSCRNCGTAGRGECGRTGDAPMSDACQHGEPANCHMTWCRCAHHQARSA